MNTQTCILFVFTTVTAVLQELSDDAKQVMSSARLDQQHFHFTCSFINMLC